MYGVCSCGIFICMCVWCIIYDICVHDYVFVVCMMYMYISGVHNVNDVCAW